MLIPSSPHHMSPLTNKANLAAVRRLDFMYRSYPSLILAMVWLISTWLIFGEFPTDGLAKSLVEPLRALGGEGGVGDCEYLRLLERYPSPCSLMSLTTLPVRRSDLK